MKRASTPVIWLAKSFELAAVEGDWDAAVNHLIKLAKIFLRALVPMLSFGCSERSIGLVVLVTSGTKRVISILQRGALIKRVERGASSSNPK